MVSLVSPACLASLCLVLLVTLAPVLGGRERRDVSGPALPTIPADLVAKLKKDHIKANEEWNKFSETLEKVIEQKHFWERATKYFMDSLKSADREKIIEADMKIFYDFVAIVEKAHQMDIAEGLAPPDRR